MKKIYLTLALAFILWFFMFCPITGITSTIHSRYFWYMMTPSALLLALLGLFFEKDNLKQNFHFEWKFVWFGIGHAIFLYGLSRFGVWIFTNLFDWAVPQIQAIYQTRTQLSPYIIGALLFGLIGPSEEIFWRGFLQKNLMKIIGEKQGTALAIALYAFVHISALNPMLLIAALVLGLHWSLIFRHYKSLLPGIISHAIWDTLIFVVFPIHF